MTLRPDGGVTPNLLRYGLRAASTASRVSALGVTS